MACPAPFLAPSDFPPNEGYVPGRFCGTITSDLACCLPCPTQDWLYSDSFERNIKIGTWFNIPSLVCQVFLLITFAIWPKAISHRHYLSVGLCISLILLHLAFIIPLGTKPNICANQLTPKDMYSSQSCAWSGALLEAGAMGISVWVLLRSLWVHLQVCWDVDILKKRAGFWAAQALGWGLPGLFLAVSFPISGVSYRVGPTCFPNTYKSFITWFGWLIAFGCLATAIQFTTTVFCLWIYLRDIVSGEHSATTTNSSGKGSRNSAAYAEEPAIQSKFDADDGARGKLAWDRVKKVVKSQWRSMVLCIGLSVFSIYFGAIFVSQARTGEKAASGESRDALVTWAFCLITNNADKSQCGGVGKAIGLNENMVVAIWPLAGLLGLLTFLLMLRGSMLRGWWRLIRHQRRHPRVTEDHSMRKNEKSRRQETFVLPKESNTTKRKSYGIRLESERPGIVSPTDSEYTGAPASPVSPIEPPDWPMSPPRQTSSQRISAYRAYNPTVNYAPTASHAPVQQVPTDGFDSSSDDEEEIRPVHDRRDENHMV